LVRAAQSARRFGPSSCSLHDDKNGDYPNQLFLKGFYKATWLARPMQSLVNATSALEAGS